MFRCHTLRSVVRRCMPVFACLAVLLSILPIATANAAAALSITPISWNMIGLDSNNVNVGPNTFLVGARVCNTGDVAATNVVSNLIWDTANQYINLSGPSSLSTKTLAAGACTDFYYNGVVTRDSNAYNTTRRYRVTATATGLGTVNTPSPRELYIEKLISQNRNAVNSITGPATVYVGGTYQFTVNGKTATGGYEQLETFLNFPNTMFQLLSVASTYAEPTGATNDKIYADACGWTNDPTSTYYHNNLECTDPAFTDGYTGGKAGGNPISTVYTVKILSAGSANLTSLIYDYSGSSYHYNSDFGSGVNNLAVTAVQNGVVSGKVFNDVNANGTQGTGENGVGGATIELLDADSNILATTTTAADGSYSFTGLVATNYFVRETDPSGYTSTTTNLVSVSVPPNGTGTANFGDQQLGVVTGTVFVDINGSGTQGLGENGIGGVTITLIAPGADGTYGTADDTTRTATTAADGTYSFNNVLTGSYRVVETDPAGYVSVTLNTVNISVPVGGSSVANFGDQQQGSISGKVFNDANGTGVLDNGELGLGGVTIQLLDSNGNVIRTTTTSTSDGSYSFTGVAPGSYTVRETDPTGYNSVTSNNIPLTIGSGTAGVANFGDRQNGTISGSVFNDVNGDGAQARTENGIAGVTIELRDSSTNTLIATTTTGSDGKYSFSNVAAGAYTVREVDPSGYVSTSLNNVPVNVPTNGSASANFGDQQVGVVSGRVYTDANGNGSQEGSEAGLAGVTVQLLNSSNAVVATTTTGADGSYSFTNVAPGTYTVRETDPGGYGSTTNNLVPVNVSTTAPATANFGDQQVGVVSGRVFVDSNGNGRQDRDASGIGGVVIELVDSTGTVIATTTTSGDGSYSFSNVAAGAYRVREIDPAGYTSTTSNSIGVNVGGTGGQASANFGDVPVGRVSGNVFLDVNGDAAQQASEGGIGGVTVQLINTSGTVVATTTTNGDGSYSFSNVAAGAYTVRELDPTGYGSTSPNDVPVSVATNGSATANFGDKQYATLTGKVYADANANGTQDFGEDGVGGVVIELLDNSGAVVATTTTVGDGSYRFAGIAPGTYTVREVDPSGYASTTPNTVTFSMTSSGVATVDFGDRQIGTVSGRVYVDGNSNGVQEDREAGIGNVTVELLNSSSVVIATTTTTNDGSYRFVGVTAGNYTVRETDPSGYASTTSNTVAITVPASGFGTANFGDRQTGTVSGKVYNDSNSNTTQDGSELGISGVTVQLLNSSNVVIATSITDSKGSYLFTNVAAGSYTVREVDPTGYLSTTTNSVPFTQPVSGFSTYNFGDQQVGSITGRAFSDTNANGLQDTGESGLSSITVQVLNTSGGVVASTTTTSTGAYVFDNIPVGTYSIKFVAPSGYSFTAQDQGANDTIDSDVNTGGQTATFTVSSTAATTPQDAGFLQLASVGDIAFVDVNRNGVQDTNEPGLAGVTVQLFKSDNTLVATRTTTASGAYSFTSLAPGSYYLKVTAPAGSSFTYVDQGTDDTKDSDINQATGQTATFTLLSGQFKNDVDVGVIAATVIGDSVYLDVDGDGVQDTSEPGLANVQLQLKTLGPDNTKGTADDVLVAGTVSDADGHFAFAGVAAGTYFIDVVDASVPTGVKPTVGTSDPSATFTVALGGTYTNLDFGYTNSSTTTAIIGDYVWSDADSDGLQDPGEVGLGGVTVTIKGAGADKLLGTADDTTVATTTTAADGSYRFTGINADEYLISATVPSGYTLTSGAQSANPATPISVRAGEVYTNSDFGFKATTAYSISDVVFYDANNNGTVNTNEGIANVTVSLINSTGQVIGTTTTDANGAFSFTGVVNGTYTIKVTDVNGKLVSYTGTTTAATTGQRSVTVSGGNVSGTNFSYTQPGVIGDTVFSDNDGDGAIDPGERTLPGITVQLYRDANGNGTFEIASDTLIGTTTTDATGKYLFGGNGTGTYFAYVDPAQTALTGYTPPTSTSIKVDLTSTVTSALTADFGFRNTALANLSGTLWNDLDRDGKLETGEGAIGGVTLALLDSNGNVIATTTTAPTITQGSNYSFPDVGPGTYTVKVTDTAGVLQGYSITAGFDTYPVTVSGTNSETNVDIGYARAPQTGSIGDTIFFDADRDGVQDAGETGISNVEVKLYPSGSTTAIATQRTDQYGRFLFNNLPAGNYYVDVTTSTLPNGGTGFTQTTSTIGSTRTINLSAGESYLAVDGGYTGPADGVTIGDRVWNDVNGNGIQDPGEPGIAGVTVTISGIGTLGLGSQTFTTGPDGTWLASGLDTGLLTTNRTYTVAVTAPNGYTVTNGTASRQFTLSNGSQILYADFGLKQTTPTTGSIGNTVYFDTNASGVKDASEPGITGVTLNLMGAGADNTLGTADDLVLATTRTDANGAYNFVGLPAGSYQVKVTDTDNVLAGLNLSGTATNPTATITLAASQVNTTTNFGYTGAQQVSSRPTTGTIGNFVWHDLNGNGVVDSGEPGLQGVTIDLYQDVDGDGVLDPALDNLIRTTTSDRTGTYEFDNLIAGKYLIQVTDTNGVLAGMTKTSGAANTNNNSQANPYPVTLTSTSSSFTSSPAADFGYKATTPLTVSGTFFNDTTNLGTFDNGEGTYTAATAYLYRDLNADGIIDATDPLIATARTNTSGVYSFTDLSAGRYIVATDMSATKLNGATQTTQTSTRSVQPINLTTANSTDNNFGFAGPTVPTAVTLISFTATATNAAIDLHWDTATELNTAGFHLYRSTDGTRASATRVTSSLIASQGSGTTGAAYTWTDNDVTPGTTYTYWLQERETGGATHEYGPVVGALRSTDLSSNSIFLPMVRR